MRLSLHTKLFLSYITLIVIIVVSVYAYLTRSLREDLYQRTRHGLLTNTRLAQSYFEAYSPDTLSYETVDPICDQLGEESGARVTIVTLDGRVLGDSSVRLADLPAIENHAARPEIVEAQRSSVGQSIRYSETVSMDMAYAAVPFSLPAKGAGVVRLALPIEGFEWIEEQTQRIVILAALTGLLIAVVLSYATSRLVSRPIEHMTNVAEQLAEGDFTVTASAPGDMELHVLADALNDMATQSKARLNQIAEENAQLEAVLSGMAEGVMVIDPDGRIIMTNPSFMEMSEMKTWEDEKRPIEMIASDDLQEAVDAALDATSTEYKDLSLKITLAGVDRTFDVHLTPIRIDQESNGLVVVFHDITELQRLEQVRRDFVANVSHELRTPLTSIKGYTETLLDGALDEPTDARRFLKSLQRHTLRLQAIVEDLLQLSRLESGLLEPDFHPCDLGALAKRVAESMEDRMISRKLELKLELELNVDKNIKGDNKLLEQVLFNLIDNAIKYTPEEGTITLRTYEKDDAVCLDVEDTGIGIPADALNRIFERFYRVDRARSREMGGTGLGLSIVRHAMETHGGRLDVESEVGRGTRFTVALPLMGPPPEEKRAPVGEGGKLTS